MLGSATPLPLESPQHLLHLQVLQHILTYCFRHFLLGRLQYSLTFWLMKWSHRPVQPSECLCLLLLGVSVQHTFTAEGTFLYKLLCYSSPSWLSPRSPSLPTVRIDSYDLKVEILPLAFFHLSAMIQKAAKMTQLPVEHSVCVVWGTLRSLVGFRTFLLHCHV